MLRRHRHGFQWFEIKAQQASNCPIGFRVFRKRKCILNVWCERNQIYPMSSEQQKHVKHARYIGRLWPYSLFVRFEPRKIGSQVTKCAWSPTPVTQNWCVPFVVACDPIRARSIIFEGSLAEKLGFWVSKLHFWRKSRRKASFLSFEASFLKEVSQKSFVLELRSSIFEGSLAEKLRLELRSFIFEGISQKSFVLELRSSIFEGSIAEKLGFWVSKLHFWRKSRRKASF